MGPGIWLPSALLVSLLLVIAANATGAGSIEPQVCPLLHPMMNKCPVGGPFPPPASTVVEVDSRKAVEVVNDVRLGKGSAIILIYSPFCPWSRLLWPVYDRLAVAFPKLTFTRLNGEKEWRFAARYMTRGFPSLLLFQLNGGSILYNGERTFTALSTFISNTTGRQPQDNPCSLKMVPSEMAETKERSAWALPVALLLSFSALVLKFDLFEYCLCRTGGAGTGAGAGNVEGNELSQSMAT
jgi:hypothetical protein